LRVLSRGWQKSGSVDLEASEMATRAALHRAGAKVLTRLLEQAVPEQRQLPCQCGGTAKYVEMRSKKILTVMGEAEVLRGYYLCPNCHRGKAPFDRELDVEGCEASPGVRRMAATVASESAFAIGHEHLRFLAGIKVTAKAIERYSEALGADIGKQESEYCRAVMAPEPPVVNPGPIETLYVEMDGTGVPVVAKEVEGRLGKVPGERARSREAKLGCVFTQTTFNEDGYPVRDEASTTYIGGILTTAEFGRRIYAEAYRRGAGSATRLVIIADGAVWIWNLVALHFPHAIQIVDLYHARKHLWDVSAILFSNLKDRAHWVRKAQRKLDAGRIEALVSHLRSFAAADQQGANALRIEAEYFERNADRMRYAEFKRRGLFVGSGVIEAGCKTLIGSRLKKSGMFWSVRGANAIINLRCSILGNQFEDYWTSRRVA
jgi:hypothetical protein